MNPLSATGLKNVWADYEQDLLAVEDRLLQFAGDSNDYIRDVTSHIIRSGGKRLRPLLMVISSRLSGYSGPNMTLLSAAVEFIHTATLLHDDVVDHAEMRRGRPSANQVWGNQASVLVGDYLYATALWMATGTHIHEINDVLTLACRKMSEGEVLELMLDNNLSAREEDYFNVVECKTAALTAGTCRMGAILGSLDSVQKKALEDFGYYIGMAFQVADDTLDYMAQKDRLGKTLGKDLSEGKMTLPLLHCLANSQASQREILVQRIGQGEITDLHLGEVVGYMKTTGSLEFSLERAVSFMKQAKQSLDPFPDSLHKQNLLALSEFIIERDL
ncbi:MAG: polyprenyl synthetase family protein [Leptospirales bacterium]